MRRKSFLGVSGAALIGTAMPTAGAAEVHVINLLPPLFPLIGRGDDAAIATVRRDLLEPNRAVFDAVLRSSIDEVSNERIRSYLLALPPYAEKMRALADSFTKTFDEQRLAFVRTFPDLAYDRPVYLLPSFTTFDGATRVVAGQRTLMFGVDGCVMFHPSEFSLPVLFHHELFHIYHQQVLHGREASFADWGLRIGLWAEGLATYASERMNPGTTDRVALLDSRLVELPKSDVAALARNFLAHIDLASEEDKWFRGGTTDAAIPQRAGYLLGLQVARRIGDRTSLPDLARRFGPDLKSEIDAALRALS